MTRTFRTISRSVVVRPPIRVPVSVPRVQIGVAVRRVVTVGVVQQTAVVVRRIP